MAAVEPEVKSSAKDPTSKYWCFTLNNYTEEEVEKVKAYKSTYTIFGKEIGESGTPHLQGYWEFHSKKKFSVLKKAFPRMHLQYRLGTSEEASKYCGKGFQSHEEWKQFKWEGPTWGIGADIWESGEISKSEQGRRSDLELVAEKIREGIDIKDIAAEHGSAFIRYHKGMMSYKELQVKKRDRNQPMIVFWIWGPSGAGKTWSIYEKHSTETIYKKDLKGWWDGYEQQDVIILDDFDPQMMDFRDFLRFSDKYEFTGAVKGNSVKINSKYCYITSEFPPEYFYGKSENELLQVVRRIYDSGGEVIEMKARSEESEGMKKAKAYIDRVKRGGSGLNKEANR